MGLPLSDRPFRSGSKYKSISELDLMRDRRMSLGGLGCGESLGSESRSWLTTDEGMEFQWYHGEELDSSVGELGIRCFILRRKVTITNSLTSTSELFSRETHQATWFTIWETAAGCYFRSLHNRKWTNHNNLLVCPLRTSIPSHLPLFPNLMEKEISQCFPHSDFPTLKGNNLLFQEWVTIGSEATTMAEVKE